MGQFDPPRRALNRETGASQSGERTSNTSLWPARLSIPQSHVDGRTDADGGSKLKWPRTMAKMGALTDDGRPAARCENKKERHARTRFLARGLLHASCLLPR